jgi:hypothetical protein
LPEPLLVVRKEVEESVLSQRSANCRAELLLIERKLLPRRVFRGQSVALAEQVRRPVGLVGARFRDNVDEP